MEGMKPARKSDVQRESITYAVRSSMRLLTKKDRIIFVSVTLIQMATGLLDLLGVFLLAYVTASALGISSGENEQGSSGGLFDILPMEAISDPDSLIVIAAVAALFLVTKSLLNILLTRIILVFLAQRQARVSANLAEQIMNKSILYLQSKPSQEFAYALTTGVNFATLMVLGQMTIALTEAVLLILLIIGLAIVSPLETIFAIVFFVFVAYFLHRILSTRAGRLGKISSSVEIGSYTAIQEAISNYREITVSNRRPYYVEYIRQFRQRASQVQADLSMVGLLPKYILEIALIVGAAILVASQLATRDAISALAVIALFLVAGSRILPSILRLQGAALVMRSAAGQAAPTYEIAEHFSPQKEDSSLKSKTESLIQLCHPTNTASFNPHVSMENVKFSYPDSQDFEISGITLNIRSGTSLALTGSTGSGKSTIADLILGIIDPDSGSVRVGGLEPSVAEAMWPGKIGYVPQLSAIANGSIRRNVALGIPEEEIDEAQVFAAIEQARLTEFLQSLPEGLNTHVGENGVRISGGQRQRLGLARALYSKPALLVLDEATSALDADTENAIIETLNRIHGDVTTIVVAHRLATVQQSDQVIYLENGLIMAQGTFQQVRSLSPGFDHQARTLGL
jgi:ATP-binding cassette subfamily C protein